MSTRLSVVEESHKCPSAFTKHREADQRGDGSSNDLRQHRHDAARPAHTQPARLSLLEVAMFS